MLELHHEAVELLKSNGFEVMQVHRYREVTATKYAFGTRGYALSRIPEGPYDDCDRRVLSLRIAENLIQGFEQYRFRMRLDLHREIAAKLQPDKYVSADVIHTVDVYDDGRDGGIGIVHLMSLERGHKYVLFDVTDMHNYEKVVWIKRELVDANYDRTGWFRYALDDEELVRKFKEQKRFEPRYLAKRREIGTIDEWSHMPSDNLYRYLRRS